MFDAYFNKCMCTSPIRIVNKTRRVVRGVTPYYLEVPCGKCEECRRNAQSDWFLRITQEISDYNKEGGIVIFATLTYNNENLPVYMWNDEEGVHSIPCFDKSHTDTFLNSIRQYFQRRLPVDGEGNYVHTGLSFHYMICAEYGQSENGTHRPHYHALFFMPKQYVDIWKENYITQTWQIKRFFEGYWNPRGFIRWSKECDGGIKVSSEFAGAYVSKYCTKDISFFSQPELEKYLYDEHHKVIKERYDAIKQYLPKHRQSKSFGIGLVDAFQDFDSLSEGVNFGFSGDIRKGRTVKYKAPRYIQRKVLYEQSPDGSFLLNEKGLDFKKYIFKQKVDKLSSFYSNMFSGQLGIDWNNYIDNGIMESLKVADNTKDRWRTFKAYITGILGKTGSSWRELALFKLSWYGCPLNQAHLTRFGELDNMDSEEFETASFNSYCMRSFAHKYTHAYCEFGYYNTLPDEERKNIIILGGQGEFWNGLTRIEEYLDSLSLRPRRFDGFVEVLSLIGRVLGNRAQSINRKYLEDRELRKMFKFKTA